MAIVIIGGTQHELPEMNFLSMERAWPSIELAMVTQDPMQGVAAALSVIAAVLMEADYFKEDEFGVDSSTLEPYLDREAQVHAQVTKFLKRKTKATEIPGIRKAVEEITKEAGLESPEGEALPSADQASPSTETLIPSSPSSLPLGLKAGAGTA